MTAAEVAAVLTAQSQKDGRVLDLARVLSLATRIEGALVRRMRLALFPDADAGLEANLWFSDLVEVRDALGIAFVPEIRDELRRQLALPEHGPALEEAWRIVEAFHQPPGQAGIPPVVASQEAITYHALATGVGEATGPASHAYKMQRLLGGWLRSLDDDSDQALASWLARALPVLPAAARQSEAAMALAARIRASRTRDAVDRVPHPVGLPAADALAGGVLAGVRRRTDGLEVTIPPRPDAHELRLPATTPLVLQVHVPTRDGWRQHPVELEPTRSHLVRGLPRASRWRLTTASGVHASLRPSLGDGGPALAVFVPSGSEMRQTPGLDHALRTTADELGWSIEAADTPSTATLLVNDGSPGHQSMFRTIRVSSFLRGVVGAARRLLVATPAGLFRIGPVPGPVRELSEARPVLSAEFDRDGSRVVTAAGEIVSVYEVESGLRLQTLAHESRVRAATFSPDGQWIATGCDDGQVHLWSLATLQRTATVRHRAAVASVEFDREGTRLVSASHDHTAVVWNVSGGTLGRATSVSHEAVLNHAAFDPSGALVVTASDDGTAAVWDCATGTRLGPLLRHAGPVHSAVWRPGAWAAPAILTACATGECVTWNAATFEPAGPPIRHDDSVEFAAYSPDGQRVVTGSAGGYASVWHADSRAPMSAPYRHVALARPADAPAARARRRRASAAVHRVDFSPDGRSLLTAGTDGRTVIWEFGATGDVGADDRWLDELTAVLAVPSGRFDASELAPALRAQLLALDEERLLEWLATAPVEDVEAAGATPPPRVAEAPTPESPTVPADSPREDRVTLSIVERTGLMAIVGSAGGAQTWHASIDQNAIAELTARTRLTRRFDERIGQKLYEIVMPRESREAVTRASALHLVLDPSFASAPWELLHDPREPLPVALRCPLVRTLESSPLRPGAPARRPLRRALVIAGPGARGPAPSPPTAPYVVARLLGERGLEVSWMEEPTREEVVRALGTGEIDLLHIVAAVRSGFPDDPPGGIVLTGGPVLSVLTAEDLALRTSPSLLLAFLDHAVGQPRPEDASAIELRLALVRAGAGAVIARSLEVDSGAAAIFAETFYRSFLDGRTVPEAVLRGRRVLRERFPDDAAWAAYQCYCDPDYRLEVAPRESR